MTVHTQLTFPVQDQGLRLEWIDNYNTPEVMGTRRVSGTDIVGGMDLRMDGPKRHAFCAANGIPFDALLYGSPTWTQNRGKIPKEKDFDVYVGTLVPVGPPTAPPQTQPSAPACPQDLPPPSYSEIANT